MSEQRHTPGPWMAGRSPVEVVNVDHGLLRNEVVSGNILIAALYDDDIGPNARLIAAAPDMLEALEQFVEEYVEMINSGDCGFWDPEKEDKVIKARAALSKAKGP